MPRCPEKGHEELCGHRLIDKGSKVVWTYNARTPNDASRARYEHLGYGIYKPMTRSDGTNYPEDDAVYNDLIDDVIGEWHDGKYPGKELYEALGWTVEQYDAWLQTPRKVPGR